MDEERYLKIRGLLPKIFKNHTYHHKPEKTFNFDSWKRLVGPWEQDDRIYLGLVTFDQEIRLEIWFSYDERMGKSDIYKVTLPNISIYFNEEKEARLVFSISKDGNISSDDFWLPFWVELQSVVWKEYDKVMNEKKI